ncbi:hypothetical protein DFH29DRAFT_1006947 [Suillus ampliporus]|nr:hypothetical protein DFH29DRAFT_1006947 [Suillus ampliporus]
MAPQEAHSATGHQHKPTEKENYCRTESHNAVQRRHGKVQNAEKKATKAQPLVQTSRNDAAHFKGPKSSNPKQPSVVAEDVFGPKSSNPKQAGVRADAFADLPELIEDDDDYESDQAHKVDGELLDVTDDEPEITSSATSGSKHRREADSPCTTHNPKIHKDVDGSRQHLKVSDFNDLTQEVLAVAISLCCTLICTQEPFPETSIMETEFAQIAWSLACKKTVLDVTLSLTLVKMITKRTSHVHGELKTKICSLAGSFYGFQANGAKAVIQQNCDHAEKLKEGSLFTYQDIESRKGIFKSDLIQMSVNDMWFVNHQDEGVAHNKYFDPIPIPTVVLVLTAIECCINEWITGIKEDITFSSANYAHIFRDHVDSLMKFDDHTYQYKLLEYLCQNLHDTARFHSGAESLATSKTAPRVSVYAFQEAIHEYEEELDADHNNVQENKDGGDNGVVDREMGGEDGEEVN